MLRRDPQQQQGARAAAAAAAELDKGNIRAAANIIEHGLAAAPGHPDLLHLAGQVALLSGGASGGKKLIREAIKKAPKIALYHYNLGHALVAENDLDGALKSFRQAVRLDSTFADAFTNLAIVFSRKGQHEEAETTFSAAARLRPDDPQVHLNLAICNMELRRPDATVAAIERVEALVDQPDSDLLHQIGNIYRGLGRHLVAEGYYRRALEERPEAPEIWYALGDVLAQAGDNDAALEALKRAHAFGFDVGLVKLRMARAMTNRGDISAAGKLLAEALDSVGNNIPYLIRIADEYTLIGDFSAQEKCLNRVMELEPDNVAAFAGLAYAPGRKLAESEALRLGKMANDKTIDLEVRTGIGFALGNYYRHAKKYDDSFRYYRLGNRLKGYSFDRAGYAQWIARIEKVFTRSFFEERLAWGSNSRLPLLIVGMPRSGTTLTEQILSAHPAVFGAGEHGTIPSLSAVENLPVPNFKTHPELAERLTKEAVEKHAESYLEKMRLLADHDEQFVTNKVPHNFEHLGLFGMLFPGTPIIHIERDPRDNLMSIYFQNFVGYHDYAYDLKTLGHYYRLYERLMAHWLDVIPNPVYSLHYEDLVADLPAKAREMADFVGIEWDERMVRFYESKRQVQTASRWQVRQPLYKTSVARWKPYERHLKPMFDALGPVEDRIPAVAAGSASP
jgi:tetratricopeptide (TPR) repeat protein